MNGVDLVIIMILTASIIYSLFRGLVREFFSLLSIILGFVAAIRLYPFPANFFLPWFNNSMIANIVSFVLTFIIVSIVISLLGRLVRKFVRFIKLESMDRLLGAVFGLLKGVFVVTVMILVLIFFLPPAHPMLTQSRLSPYFITLGEVCLSMIPVNIEETVRKKTESFSTYWRKPSDNLLNLEGDEEGNGGVSQSPLMEKERS